MPGGPIPGGPITERPGTEHPPTERPDDWERWEEAASQVIQADHPVLVGYDGSEPSRHALAYAAGMSRRLGPRLLVAYVTSPGIFCEPLTGQVIAALRDSAETQRWLLAELDEVFDRAGLDDPDPHPAGQPGPGTGRRGRRVQRGRPGHRGAEQHVAPCHRIGTRLAGPARALPGDRRALTGTWTLVIASRWGR